MRVGASRPRQTSQGDDKEKHSNEEATRDSANTSGKEGSSGNKEDADNEQGSGYVCKDYFKTPRS